MSEIQNPDNPTLEKLIREVDYVKMGENYIPSKFAIKFINFIKLVNGESGEENKSPIFHYDILDTIYKNKNVLIVSFRGSAKTTLVVEYLILYIAVFGELDGFGKINVGIYVGDTMDNGVKNLRANLEHRYNNSEFLQKFIVHARFTDVEWEFTNAEGHKSCWRGFGAASGVRGFKKYGERPQIACHARGTPIVTDIGEHLVEDYYHVHPSKFETGKKVRVCGLLDEEIVTNDHRYKCVEVTKTRHKKYNKVSNGVYTTSSTTEYSYSDFKWVEAKDLKKLGKLGNQQRITHYIVKPIDRTVGSVQPILQTFERINVRDDKGRIVKTSKYTTEAIYEPMLKDSFWWLYGLWLADGHRSENAFHFTVANTQKDTVGEKIIECVKDIGLHVGVHVTERLGCYQLTVSSKAISTWLKKYKRGISVKDIPKWVLQLPLEKQKQILLGYIAGDGYVDLANNQVRINSVNLNVLRQLGVIAERLGLPYHIRNTKKAGTETFPNGQVYNVRHQYEIRFRDNVNKVLGIPITDNPDVIKQVFIEDGYIYRRVRSVIDSEETEFIPITTPSHEYLTSFGISHNCLDDLMSDKSAESKTIIKDIENVIYKAVRQAMHPTKRKVIWIGTPFNKKDPLYKAAGTKAWSTKVYPICMQFPCTKENFVGAWEDRFPYEAVRAEYDMLKENGRVDAFNQELMLRILSDDDRLVLDEDIVWYTRNTVLNNLQDYNIYITTDFATSEKEKADFSVISVWALDWKGRFHWIDGIVKRQDMAVNVDDVFRFVQLYVPLLTGVEISGQQKGFVSWLKREMTVRSIYFMIASDKSSGEEGLRPNTSKLTRFNIALPLFKQRKIAFPEELKESAAILEFIDELSSVTPSGFKSLHDDCADTISQLPLIEYFTPIDPKFKRVEERSMSSENNYYFTEPQEECKSSYIV